MLVTELKAKIKTKSNFRGLNGEWLPVLEIIGKRITCQYYDFGLGKTLSVDFAINEIEEFSK